LRFYDSDGGAFDPFALQTLREDSLEFFWNGGYKYSNCLSWIIFWAIQQNAGKYASFSLSAVQIFMVVICNIVIGHNACKNSIISFNVLCGHWPVN
jgi:hypothetical protein